MRFTRLPLYIAAAGLAIAMGTATIPAYAQPTTFAQFDQASKGDSFQFFNSSGSFDTVSSPGVPGPAPVNFDFLVHTSFGAAGTPIAATLTMTGTTSSGIINDGTNLDQPIDSLSLLFKTVGPNPVTLLTVNIENVTLVGAKGSNVAASINANPGVSNGTGVASVTYASSYVNFSGSDKNSAGLTFSGITNYSAGTNGFLNNFRGAGAGTFAASHAGGTGPVPEAGTVVSFGVLLGLGALFLIRRNKD